MLETKVQFNLIIEKLFLLLSIILYAGVPVNGGGTVVAGVVGVNILVFGERAPGHVFTGGAGEVLPQHGVETTEGDEFPAGKVFVLNDVIDRQLVAGWEGIGEFDPLAVTFHQVVIISFQGHVHFQVARIGGGETGCWTDSDPREGDL